MALQKYFGQGLDAAPSDGPPEIAYTTLIDYVGGNVPIYIGWAFSSSSPGALDGWPTVNAIPSTGPATSDSYWAIKKITYDGSNNVIQTQWAGGSTKMKWKWDDRATLTYT